MGSVSSSRPSVSQLPIERYSLWHQHFVMGVAIADMGEEAGAGHFWPVHVQE